jgi:hypothetical protein
MYLDSDTPAPQWTAVNRPTRFKSSFPEAEEDFNDPHGIYKA